MSDTVGIRLDLQRQPFNEVPVDDVDGLRAHLRTQLEGRHGLFDRVLGAARFFGDGFQEMLLLDDLVEVGQEALLARAVVEIGGRDGIARTFREGEVLVRSDAGGLRRAAGLMELTADGDGAPRWWLAWRLIGTGPDGAGQWLGDWETLSGSGEELERLPEGFDEWVDVGSAEVQELVKREERPGPPPQMTGGLAPFSGPAPRDLLHAAQLLAPECIPQVLATGVAATHVFVLSAERIDSYRYEAPPVSQLDMIRNLVARTEEPVLAVAVANLTALNTPEGVRRGLGLVVEHDRQRMLLFSDLRNGPDGKLQVSTNATGVPQGDVGDDTAWIGMPPSQTIELALDWMQAPGGLPVTIGDA